MKKLYILVFTFLWLLGFSQNSLLFDKNWKVEKVTVNGSTIDISADQTAFFMRFYSDFLFNYVSDICSENFGKVTFNNVTNDFVITEANTYLGNCQPTNLDTNYSLFFTKNSSAVNKITYDIVQKSNGYDLTLSNISGDQLTFSYYTPPTNLSSQNWVIESLNINGTNYNKPTQQQGDNTMISSDGDFQSDYFNGGHGTVGFYADNRFRLLNLSVTLAVSDDPQIMQFDGLYFGNFFSGDRTLPYSYDISNGTETLVITKYNGDKATYSKKVLATSEISKSRISVYPNPATAIVIIENLKPNASLELIDNSGKIVRSLSNSKSNKTEINIKNLPSEIYYLKVDGQSVQKVIKK